MQTTTAAPAPHVVAVETISAIATIDGRLHSPHCPEARADAASVVTATVGSLLRGSTVTVSPCARGLAGRITTAAGAWRNAEGTDDADRLAGAFIDLVDASRLAPWQAQQVVAGLPVTADAPR